jgi:alkyl hydroperoxide reductase subunit AhpF
MPVPINVTIRVGDDAAETHAWARARNIIRSDGAHWEEMALGREFERQLGKAVDRYCPQCSYRIDDPSI